MRGVVVAAIGMMVAVSMAGCFDPFRAHVPAAALEASPMEWNVTKGAVQGKTFGTKTTETRYVFDPDDGPPHPGVLQVFSLRGDNFRDGDALLRFTQDVVDEAIAREGISIDHRQDASGKRELRNGLDTQWFMHHGRIASASDDSILLPQGEDDLVVRILGETAYDGRSKTAFVAIAFVQVGTHSPGALPPFTPEEETLDMRTWFEIVADTNGSVDGATLPAERGLLTHLRTHD